MKTISAVAVFSVLMSSFVSSASAQRMTPDMVRQALSERTKTVSQPVNRTRSTYSQPVTTWENMPTTGQVVQPGEIKIIVPRPAPAPVFVTEPLVYTNHVTMHESPLPEHYPHLTISDGVLHTISEDWHLGNYGTLAPDLLEKVQHDVANPELREWGVTELLSVGVTDFKNSTPERKHNVLHSFAKLDGHVIAPGKTFSFWDAVGNVSLDTGYKNAKVINRGVSVDGVGGGVCQSSTTLFRAAYMAGLPIVEHRHHSFALPYYGTLMGLDATVWNPTIDVKFRNDTGKPVLMRTEVRGTKAMLFLYGTKDRDTVLLQTESSGGFVSGAQTNWTREVYHEGIPIIDTLAADYIPYEDDES